MSGIGACKIVYQESLMQRWYYYLDKVAEYKSGKGANPARVNELLKEKLQ